MYKLTGYPENHTTQINGRKRQTRSEFEHFSFLTNGTFKQG